MNVALWVLQVLLGIFFVFHSYVLLRPPQRLQSGMSYGAIVFHVRRREYPNIGLNAVLGVLSAVVAWGRFGPYHF
jgi:uncharacterized membrane protein HdeD (DUF308 family)